MEIHPSDKSALERSATVPARDLPPTLLAWVRDLLRAEPSETAEVTVTLRQPGITPSPFERAAARERLLALMGRIGERTRDIPQSEIDDAIDEAMRSVRAHPTDANHA